MTSAQAVAITIVILVALTLINWARQDTGDWPISHVLPLVGGHEPGFYDLAGLAMIAMFLSGISNLIRPKAREDEWEYEEEPYEEPDNDDSP